MQQTKPTADEFVELFKAAIDRGHVVIIPTPAVLVEQHPPTQPNNLLAMACAARFRLTRAEARVLAKLLQHEYVGREDLHRIVARTDNPVTRIEIVGATISQLRKKLASHRVRIVTIDGLGFMIGKSIRDRVLRMIGRYDESISEAAATPSGRATEDL